MGLQGVYRELNNGIRGLRETGEIDSSDESDEYRRAGAMFEQEEC